MATPAKQAYPLGVEINPHECPSCDATDSFQEIGKRPTWQPLTFKIHQTEGLLEDDYSSHEWGDDVDVEGFECRECFATWPTVKALENAMVRKALVEVLYNACPQIKDELLRDKMRTGLDAIGELA